MREVREDPSQSGRPVRERKLSQRLYGFDLDGGRGVGGLRNAQEEADGGKRPKRRNKAADYFSPSKGSSSMSSPGVVISTGAPGICAFPTATPLPFTENEPRSVGSPPPPFSPSSSSRQCLIPPLTMAQLRPVSSPPLVSGTNISPTPMPPTLIRPQVQQEGSPTLRPSQSRQLVAADSDQSLVEVDIDQEEGEGEEDWPPTFLPHGLQPPTENDDPSIHIPNADAAAARVLVGQEVEAGGRGNEGREGGAQGPSWPSSQSQDTTPDFPPIPEGFPSLETAHTTSIPTHKFPPKAARAEFSRQMTAVWERLARNPNNDSAWILEYIFSRVILPAGQGPRQGDAYSQARVVKERLRRWKEGDYAELWKEAVELTKTPPKGRKQRTGARAQQKKTLEQKNAQRAGQLAQEGQYRKSLQTLTSAGMAEHSRATEQEMRNKHPPASGPSSFQPSTPDVPQLQFTRAEVEKAAFSFRKGSAPGPSGLRPEHLRVTLKGAPINRTEKAGAALTRVVNLMAKGEVARAVAPYLGGARLHGALKKDGGLRPIAVGNLLRRLTSKLVASALAS